MKHNNRQQKALNQRLLLHDDEIDNIEVLRESGERFFVSLDAGETKDPTPGSESSSSSFCAKFHVIGSTGNMYVVKLRNDPEIIANSLIKLCTNCSCPDFTLRKITCKHIYFVLSRVLRLPELLWKKGTNFMAQDFLDIYMGFKNFQKNRLGIIHNPDEKVVESRDKGDKGVLSVSVEKTNQRSVTEQKECSICLCDFEANEKLVFCYKTCGYNFHELCFQRWILQTKKHQCPLCRSEMKIVIPNPKKRKMTHADRVVRLMEN